MEMVLKVTRQNKYNLDYALNVLAPAAGNGSNGLFSWFITIWPQGWHTLSKTVMSSNTDEEIKRRGVITL